MTKPHEPDPTESTDVITEEEILEDLEDDEDEEEDDDDDSEPVE